MEYFDPTVDHTGTIYALPMKPFGSTPCCPCAADALITIIKNMPAKLKLLTEHHAPLGNLDYIELVKQFLQDTVKSLTITPPPPFKCWLCTRQTQVCCTHCPRLLENLCSTIDPHQCCFDCLSRLIKGGLVSNNLRSSHMWPGDSSLYQDYHYPVRHFVHIYREGDIYLLRELTPSGRGATYSDFTRNSRMAVCSPPESVSCSISASPDSLA